MLAPLLLLALAAQAPAPGVAQVVVSIVGTNDLHGRIEVLPRFGGYLKNLRRVRARDGGGVVLLDAGDMFQGTLPSNLGEGAAVVRAYNALEYSAAAVGNHEFDFGPEGPAATPRKAEDDPRGALKARAVQARFPLLAANLFDAATDRRVDWRNMPASTVIAAGGLRIGVIGLTTMGTPRTTIASNFRGLTVAPLAPVITDEARALREAGADAVVVVAHAGGECRQFGQPDDISACDGRSEIFQVARALPAGAVDLIVAGHTHEGLAHRVAGIPIIESYAEGRAFGRVDLTFVVNRGDRRNRARLVGTQIFPPQSICAAETCAAQRYQGAPVVPDRRVQAAIAPDLKAARALREERLGPLVTTPLTRDRRRESSLGNLFADLMRAATPAAEVAITNGGSLRADIPAGPLTYGQLFEAFPFDNRLATVKMSGAELQRTFAQNLSHSGAIVSISGVRVSARCEGGALLTTLLREPAGTPINGDDQLTVVTSDFLAMGGDALFSESVQRTGDLDGELIREAMAKLLRARGGPLSADQPGLLDPARPRIAFPGQRPVRCNAPVPPAPPGPATFTR